MPDNAPAEAGGFRWATKEIESQTQQNVHIMKTMSVDDEGMPDMAFSRLKKVSVPVTPTSMATPFDMTGLLPVGADGQVIRNLTFLVENLSNYDMILEGTPAGVTPFVVADPLKSWIIPARTVLGPFFSKKPASLSCGIIATAGRPLSADPAFLYPNHFLSLIYGRGN